MPEQLPGLLGGVRREQRYQHGQHLRRLADGRVGRPGPGVDCLPGGADQLHQPGHGHVQVVRLHLAGDLVDGPVGDPAQFGVAGSSRLFGRALVRFGYVGGDPPDPAEELDHGFRVHVRPVDIVLVVG